MSRTGLASRKAALTLLRSVLEYGRPISRLGGSKGPLSGLCPPEAAYARRLSNETLRWMDRADRLLERYLHKTPPMPVMNILRLATVEICQLGEAAHGVVNDAVTLVRSSRDATRFSKLVNAILRKVAAEGPALWSTFPTPRLPEWLRRPMVSDYGEDAVALMEAVHADAPPLDLTPRDGNSDSLARRVGGTALPNGSVRLSRAGQVSALPGYDTGDWWVQDAAAAMPVAMLNPERGEDILDLCAAPGGKTMQLTASGANVTAIDRSKFRMKRMLENLHRTGMFAHTVVGDALEHKGRYDAILLDPPCTATGTIRRHPDLPHAGNGSGLEALLALQEQLIDHALTLLRSGGRLVYCTCSLLTDEGEVQTRKSLARHPVLSATPHPRLPWIEPEWTTPEGGLRLRPDYWADKGGMDGFYMICLRKK